MIEIRELDYTEKDNIEKVVNIHVDSFKDFFLTSLGKGFLYQLYISFCKHNKSGLLVAFEDNDPVGFLAYSTAYSELFKYMIKTRLIPFAWYSFVAFIKKPSIFVRILKAFLKPSETKRSEPYIEISSLGVKLNENNKGIGTKLIDKLKEKFSSSNYEYISLETDAIDNEYANKFYKNNGFNISRQYTTSEGREMYEYRYSLK